MKQTGKKSNSNGFFRFFWYRILSGERLFGLQRHKIFTCTDGGMYGSSIHTKKSARLKGNGITIPKG